MDSPASPRIASPSSSPASSSAAVDSSSSSEHQPPLRRRLVKTASIKRESAAPAGGSYGNPSSPSGNIGIPGSAGFRERERSRSSIKDTQLEHPTHTTAGATPGLAKFGRSHIPNPAPIDARPLGRRSEGVRRLDPTAGQKHTEDLRLQQRRAAVLRQKTVGATGSYKEVDSLFGNYLLPVIPTHLAVKQPQAAASVSQPVGR